MFKKLSVLLFFICLSVAVFAQNAQSKITGKIIGKTNGKAIEYVSVALYNSKTSKPLTGLLTDSTGHFQFKNIARGTYYILCSYVGYKDVRSQNIVIDNSGRNIDLGNFIMDDSAETLNTVFVEGKRSTYTQTIDKKIFNIGSDIISSSGSVSDLMQNIPSVQVDVEGNISLRGNENVLVLIDGKPSVLMKGTNRGTVLQQLPANSIDRIEVITNPSARYKPDGTSGIINLVTKKHKTVGLTGNVIANYGNHGRYNAGASISYTLPKFSITGSYNYRHDRRDRYVKNERTLTDSLGNKINVIQNTVSMAPSSSHIFGIALQADPTPKDRFEAGYNVTLMSFPRREHNHLIQSSGSVTSKDFDRFRHDDEKQNSGEGTAGYTHTFSKDKTLTLDYTGSFENELERNLYTNTYTLPTAYVAKDNTRIRQKTQENLIRAIYDAKMKNNSELVAGYEAELDKSDMRYFAEDSIGGSWIKNLNKSNDFIFNEAVNSLYVTYEQSFDKFGFMAGVRGEQSNIKSKLITLNQTVKDNYFYFYPTLHTSYKLDDRNELQLNYSLRVNRPEGYDLNPFPEYQDPYNVIAGNPYLRPEKIHSIELGWQYKYNNTTVILTPYYRYTYHKITDITVAMGDGVMKTTKQNMSSGSAAGAEFILNSSLGKFFTFNVNSNLFYNKIDASDLGYSNKKSAFAWYVSFNGNANLTKNLMFQLNTRYNSSNITPQGKRKPSFITNAGIKYDIPKWNISLTATATDLFDSYKNITEINTPSIQQRIERRRSSRILYFGIAYRFGTGSKNHDSKLQYDEY